MLIDWTLTGTTTLGQSGPRSNGNKGVLHRSEASPSNGLVSYLEYSLGGFHLSVEMQLVYSTASDDQAKL